MSAALPTTLASAASSPGFATDESAAERRGKEISKRLLSRWANMFLGSALLLSIALPNLLSPAAVWTADARWSGTTWFATIYGVTWGGASVYALLTLLASLVLSNTVGSAMYGDVEAIVTALAAHELAAQLCSRRRDRRVCLTAALDVVLAVLVLGTSWRPPVLLSPGVFFRPCLAFFFLATTWAVYFTLPIGVFAVHCTIVGFGMAVALAATRTVHDVINELAADVAHVRVSPNGLLVHPKAKHATASRKGHHGMQPPPTHHRATAPHHRPHHTIVLADDGGHSAAEHTEALLAGVEHSA